MTTWKIWILNDVLKSKSHRIHLAYGAHTCNPEQLKSWIFQSIQWFVLQSRYGIKFYFAEVWFPSLGHDQKGKDSLEKSHFVKFQKFPQKSWKHMPRAKPGKICSGPVCRFLHLITSLEHCFTGLASQNAFRNLRINRVMLNFSQGVYGAVFLESLINKHIWMFQTAKSKNYESIWLQDSSKFALLQSALRT